MVLPVGSLTLLILFLLIPSRWLSLLVVMAGVGLVGYSGSLIKDAVTQATLHILSSPGNPSAIQGEAPELTRAVVGTLLVSSPVVFISITQRCILRLAGANLVCSITNSSYSLLIPHSS